MVTVFRVQPYWRNGRRLEPSRPEEFLAEREARRAAERLFRSCAGVAIYAVQGEPEFDYWAEPIVIARLGAPAVG